MLVNVDTSFTLNRPTSEKVLYEIGEQCMPEEDALHTYSQYHITIIPTLEAVVEPVVDKTKRNKKVEKFV